MAGSEQQASTTTRAQVVHQADEERFWERIDKLVRAHSGSSEGEALLEELAQEKRIRLAVMAGRRPTRASMEHDLTGTLNDLAYLLSRPMLSTATVDTPGGPIKLQFTEVTVGKRPIRYEAQPDLVGAINQLLNLLLASRERRGTVTMEDGTSQTLTMRVKQFMYR